MRKRRESAGLARSIVALLRCCHGIALAVNATPGEGQPRCVRTGRLEIAWSGGTHEGMAHLDGETSNALFATLEDWNSYLTAEKFVLGGPQP